MGHHCVTVKPGSKSCPIDQLLFTKTRPRKAAFNSPRLTDVQTRSLTRCLRHGRQALQEDCWAKKIISLLPCVWQYVADWISRQRIIMMLTCFGVHVLNHDTQPLIRSGDSRAVNAAECLHAPHVRSCHEHTSSRLWLAVSLWRCVKQDITSFGLFVRHDVLRFVWQSRC